MSTRSRRDIQNPPQIQRIFKMCSFQRLGHIFCVLVQHPQVVVGVAHTNHILTFKSTLVINHHLRPLHPVLLLRRLHLFHLHLLHPLPIPPHHHPSQPLHPLVLRQITLRLHLPLPVIHHPSFLPQNPLPVLHLRNLHHQLFLHRRRLHLVHPLRVLHLHTLRLAHLLQSHPHHTLHSASSSLEIREIIQTARAQESMHCATLKILRSRM